MKTYEVINTYYTDVDDFTLHAFCLFHDEAYWTALYPPNPVIHSGIFDFLPYQIISFVCI